MKFEALQSNFAKVLGQVNRIVSSRTTLPVLSNLMLSTDKGKVRLSATDLEVAITSFCPAKIEKEGKLTIPARLLSDFVANNHDEAITFSIEKENILSLKSEHYTATINGISAEEFPTIPSIPSENVIKLDSKELADSIKKVIIATAMDETRPVLAGIYFEFRANTLILAATDSFRLAEKKIELIESLGEKKIIVPSRTMAEVLRLISGLEDIDTVLLSFTENQVAFRIGETEVISRLIEGLYPNYAQIMPKSHKIRMVAKNKELLDAVKLSFLFSKNSASNIRFSSDGKNIIVSSAASETGETRSKVAAEITGDKVEIAFNARFILDALQIISSEKVALEFNDEASPGAIRGEKDKNFTYIAMPLKIDQ